MRISFIVEGTTDVRMIEGLAERCELSVVGRHNPRQSLVNHPPTLPFSLMTGPASRLRFFFFVWRLLRQKNVTDGVIVQGYGITALAANLARRTAKVPVFMLVCSPSEAYYRCRRAARDPAKPFRLYELWLMQGVARLNALLGNHYIALSHYLAHVITGNSRTEVDVIPIYGVDTHLFTPSSQPKAAIRAELGLPSSGSLLFFSSRIAPEKDSVTLLTAFKSLREEGRDLWLLNRSGGHEAMQKAAQRLGVDDRVITTDAVHPLRQLPRDYQAADLCIQASREEGLGFSPLEALACGVPVIATSVGGLQETIKDGQTGWTYPVGNSQALSEKIKDALDNPLEAARRASEGRTLVCSLYDKDIVFDRLIQVLERASLCRPQNLREPSQPR